MLGHIVSLGIDDALEPYKRRRVALSNQIALLLVPVVLIGIVLNVTGGDAGMALGFVALLPVIAAVPLLNQAGRRGASRLVLIAAPPIVLVLAPMLSGSISVGNFLAIPYAILTMSLLPLLLFHSEEERILRRIGITLLALFLFTHDRFLMQVLTDEAHKLMAADYTIIKLPQVILWAAILASNRFVAEGD